MNENSHPIFIQDSGLTLFLFEIYYNIHQKSCIIQITITTRHIHSQMIPDSLNMGTELHNSSIQKQSSPPGKLLHVSEDILSAFNSEVNAHPR